MAKGQGNWERKCKKIVFRAYRRPKWINLHQTKTRMISGPVYTYRHQRKCFFV